VKEPKPQNPFDAAHPTLSVFIAFVIAYALAAVAFFIQFRLFRFLSDWLIPWSLLATALLLRVGAGWMARAGGCRNLLNGIVIGASLASLLTAVRCVSS